MRPAHRPPPRPALTLPGALLALVAVTASAGAFMLSTAGQSPARAAGGGSLQQQVTSARQRAFGLAGAVATGRRRVAALSSGISALSEQLAAVQGNLRANRDALLRLRGQLDAAQATLKRRESTAAADERVLAAQLVGDYEGDRPDIITVVVEASGFHDLLERLQFAQRVGNHDAQVVGSAQAARRAVATEAVRIGALSQRQQQLTEQVATERNRVVAAWVGLISQRLAAAQVQAARATALTATRSLVTSLSARLAKLQADERTTKPPSQARSSAPHASAPAPVSGDFEFPMPKADVSPEGTWSLDDGVDIAAPGGTPELAVCSGTVVLHGIGGFGPSAPVLHCDAPLDGYRYVYYGHAGPGNWVPIGTHLAQGQVVSQVGYGIVGISSGPHLEIGFADPSGSPIGPSTAPAMMAQLRAAYGA
jgi:murein DD-endopeptidase MepM/ murein hydrolase activator NlpD